MFASVRRPVLWLTFCLLAGGQMCQRSMAAEAPAGIESLSQHFNQPGKSIDPWMFVPKENILDFSTTMHPGLAVFHEAGKGHDLKGILKKAIRIDDYRLPWEFQLAMPQCFNAMLGINTIGQ